MKKIAFFDAKPYDRTWFDQLNQHYHIKYYEHKLTPATISLAHGCEAVIPFVNDTLDRTVIDGLCQEGIKMIALRCAGYNNVDRDAARGRIPVVRVPGYSPYAVAEFTMGLLLTLNRKIHKAYFRTRDFNFSLNGLVGFDLHGRTVGVIGTGKIGQIFIRICQGFGMHVLAYDPYPVQDAGFPYVSLEELLAKSDIISLHCPLTEQTRHLINRDTIPDERQRVSAEHLPWHAGGERVPAGCPQERQDRRRRTGCLRGGDGVLLRGSLRHGTAGYAALSAGIHAKRGADLPSGISHQRGAA